MLIVIPVGTNNYFLGINHSVETRGTIPLFIISVTVRKLTKSNLMT